MHSVFIAAEGLNENLPLSLLAAIAGLGAIFGTSFLGWLTRRRQEREDDQLVILRRSLSEITRDDLATTELMYKDATPSADEENALDTVESIRQRTTTSYQALTNHYGNALSQSRIYAYLSYAVGLLGFIIMIVGVCLVYTGSLDSGLVAAGVGIVVESAAGLVFVQARKANSDSQQNLRLLAETVRDDNNREIAVHLASQIIDPLARDRAIGELARQAMLSATIRSEKGTPSSQLEFLTDEDSHPPSISFRRPADRSTPGPHTDT